MYCRVIATACVIATIAGAAAATGAPELRGTPQVDACSLLDSTEISEVLGLPVDVGAPGESGYESDGSYSSACVWTIDTGESARFNPSAPLGGRSFAILHVMKWPDGSEQSAQYLQAFREAALHGEIPSEPVPRELGDEALWWGDGLAVRRGDTSFGLSVFLPGMESTPPGEFEERLAPLVLRRLVEE